MVNNGKDWFAGEDHEVEAMARDLDAEAGDEGWSLDAVLLADHDWDRRNRAG